MILSMVSLFPGMTQVAGLIVLVGEGEFGTVHKAKWYGTIVAVKILRRSDAVAVGDFRYTQPRPLQAQGLTDHPKLTLACHVPKMLCKARWFLAPRLKASQHWAMLHGSI